MYKSLCPSPCRGSNIWICKNYGLPKNMHFFIFNNFFYVFIKFFLVFTCTVQNNLLLLLFLFPLHIITLLIYYFIHLYLIYFFLHMVLLFKTSDLPGPYIFPPYWVLTSVSSWKMHYISSHFFHCTITAQQETWLHPLFLSLTLFPSPSLLFLPTLLLFTIRLFSIPHALLWESLLSPKCSKVKETFQKSQKLLSPPPEVTIMQSISL